MPRYYFELDDGEFGFTDEEGSEHRDAREAGNEAIGALTHLAKDKLPNGDCRDFKVDVRDQSGRLIFHGTLAFRGVWMR
ncbi:MULTISPECIES: DUF6894 family protein [Methylobacterium]|uniref:DUF6894 domain-containing protein n=1 Tax=Methylobacterium thuringiense TaxID=1003091 RepID=A0ABQ4TLD9_9HYPH|nr:MULTISPECIES: hypothetical protein [Methylobacterium]TXN23696.1 hypothetical protein FV217_05760 [Methylobacterium sp. WL9]GJE56158.1 hypothetical protein EKPJFOCH_2657 [Methylobacterium thuringiense]